MLTDISLKNIKKLPQLLLLLKTCEDYNYLFMVSFGIKSLVTNMKESIDICITSLFCNYNLISRLLQFLLKI